MSNKEKFIALLKKTKRYGIDYLIEWLEINEFFTAPCSTQHHLCREGGLLEHSLNVYECMNSLANCLLGREQTDDIANSIIICSLLHDVGKVGQFGKPYYVENYLSKTDKEGNPIRSTSKPYITNAELLNVPHEIRSLLIIDRHIDLTEKEQFAILYHNGMYSDLKYQLNGKETPLYLLLHTADMWCSRVTEVEQQPE